MKRTTTATDGTERFSPPLPRTPPVPRRQTVPAGPPSAERSPESLAERVDELERRLAVLEAGGGSLACAMPLLARIADAVAPVPAAVVGTPYVAQKLGCTTVWVAELVRKGDVPRQCVVPGTGVGRVWKFYRDRIDAWITGR